RVTATRAADNNYSAATSSAAVIAVAKASQTITFGALAGKTFGDGPFALSATATSGAPVSYSVVSGPASIAGNIVTITGAGTVVVRASQAGNNNYTAAPTVDQPFTVAPAVPTIAWNTPADISYGTPLG